MTSDEHTAKALARWLEQPPGTEPPSELGRDVVEAVYALRPDLAPAPRLTADDILADVRRGPLAHVAATPSSTGSQEGAEVVAFPGERMAELSDSDPDLAARPGRRMWWWVGGTGGVGLALVAAATLALVALPRLKQEQEEATILVASPDAAEAPATRPAAAAADLRKDDDAVEGTLGAKGSAEPPSGYAASAPPPAAARTRSADVPSGVRPNEAREMVGLGAGASVMNDEVAPMPIAEVVAASESNTGAAPQEAEKAEAKQRAAVADAGQTEIDEETRDRIDETVKRAEKVRKKDKQAAASILAEVIAPPADVGQYAAVVAAERSLEEGDPAAALEIARQGLALSDLETPERARLMEIETQAVMQQQAETQAP